jgi:chromosome segregation protein
MDTGLGRDGYAIIGQGKVADIIGSKSGDRREIFEEAASISKFRYKKEEAERKLKAADENIVRLRDIISELEQRVEPLRIQSEKAKKFIELADEKKGIEISVWIHKSHELKAQLSQNEDLFLMKNGEYESLENDLEKLEKVIEQAYLDMQKCTVKIEQLRSEILDSERLKAQIFSEIAVLENDIEHISASILQLEEKQQQSQLSSEQSQRLISDQEQKYTAIIDNEERLSDEIALTTAGFDELLSQAEEFDKSFGETTALLNSLYIKKSEYDFLLASDEKSIAEAKQTIKNSLIQQEEIDGILSGYSREKSELNKAMNNIEEQLEEHNNRLSGYIKLFERKFAQLTSVKNEHSQTMLKITELSQKQKLLTELENSMEGFANSVREVVKAGKNGRISGIRGTVAQLIKIDGKYSVAIETALGGALQNVVVENEETAKRCISMLKEQNSGRATFLPMTSVRGNTISENGLEKNEGFISIASEIISCDKEYGGIIKNLLGRIVIAENIDFAAAIAKKYGYKFRVVTLDGQVINAGGSFTGGSVSRSTGVLTRKNEISKINVSLKKLNADSKILNEKLLKLQAETDKLSYDIDGEKDEISKLSSDKIRFEGEIKHFSAMINQAESNADETEKSIVNLNAKLALFEKQLDENGLALKLCEEKITENEQLLSSGNDKRESLRAEREGFSEKLSELKMKQIELKRDREACVLMSEQLKSAVLESESGSKQLEEQQLQLKSSIDEKKSLILIKKAEAENVTLSVEKINLDIKSEQSKHAQAERYATEQRNFQKIKNEEKEKISREIARYEEKKLAVQKEYDSIISELWEQYQLSRSEALQLADRLDDVTAAQKKLNELKNRIKNLGSVNVAAIEEYTEVSQRYEYLSAQLEDVECSKSELEKLISELTESMKEIFLESFNTINDNFRRIFVELFGGGKAELSLSDASDVLESGIEINVAPPGKVIKSLSLLSGGEQAFVAIAIYFSILKLKPAPFCILDEIEAALDDVNVSKYATYLRNFTDTTQFILITHRRGTMEEADILYGVTMQEKGISKLLKMDVRDTVNISN